MNFVFWAIGIFMGIVIGMLIPYKLFLQRVDKDKDIK
jgi:hypothetical protein